jgi:kinesin family protein 5
MSASTCNVRVVCRFRPVNEREKREGGDANELAFPSAQGVRVKALDFTFDRVFENALQDDVYQQVQASIEDVLNGFNSTVFAYGQTGSGKSFTMFGDVRSEKLRGIIPRACHHIFSHIAEDESGTEWQIKSSFLEIYQENVRDLLSTEKDKTSLKVKNKRK